MTTGMTAVKGNLRALALVSTMTTYHADKRKLGEKILNHGVRAIEKEYGASQAVMMAVDTIAPLLRHHGTSVVHNIEQVPEYANVLVGLTGTLAHGVHHNARDLPSDQKEVFSFLANCYPTDIRQLLALLREEQTSKTISSPGGAWVAQVFQGRMLSETVPIVESFEALAAGKEYQQGTPERELQEVRAFYWENAEPKWERSFRNLQTVQVTDDGRVAVATSDAVSIRDVYGELSNGWNIPGVYLMAFDATGDHLAVLTRDKKLYYLSLSSQEIPEPVDIPHAMSHIKMSPDGNQILLAYLSPIRWEGGLVHLNLSPKRYVPFNLTSMHFDLIETKDTTRVPWGGFAAREQGSGQTLFADAGLDVPIHSFFVSQNHRYAAAFNSGYSRIWKIEDDQEWRAIEIFQTTKSARIAGTVTLYDR